MTSERLSAGAPVKNRMFPKVRSWFALGAPLGLLSPLSVARVLALLAVPSIPLVGWAADAPRLVPLAAAWAGALAILAGLLRAKELSRRQSHAGTVLAAGLAGLVGWAVRGGADIAGPLVFVVLAGVFAGIFFDGREVLAHQAAAALLLGGSVLPDRGVAAAAFVALVTFVGAGFTAMTVALLTYSARSHSAVDPDTGLPNGFGLSDRLRRDGHESLVMAAVVLKGLDEAREALGYQVGTELLRRAVEDLGQVMHADAVIARIDGDVLVVAQPVIAGHDATAVGAELAAHLIDGIGAGRYVVAGVEVALRAHVGLAFAPDDTSDVTDLVRLASLSARQAIDAGVRHAHWDGTSPALTAKDLTVLADLRLAPERGELWVAYQPQISPRTRRPVAVEALLRWTTPTHGFVPPGVFIPLAERTGLIERLTTWVFDEALDAQARWRAAGVELPVSINLSPLSLFDPALPERILEAVHTRGLPPESLTVEVTESAALEVVQAVDRLRPLRDAGIRISIDDFGTGYTSLSVLPHLPLSELKVDQKFVRASLTSPADEAIVHAVLDLAHRLGLECVAEGVEDAELADRMSAAGFDLLQGYHFAKPLAEADLLAFMAPYAPRQPADL